MSKAATEIESIIKELQSNVNEMLANKADIRLIQLSTTQADKLTIFTAETKAQKDKVRAAFTDLGIAQENVAGQYYFRVNIADVKVVLAKRKVQGLYAMAKFSSS